jgi:ATP-binding cassette subfamily B (MDR/TAP) protein 1
MIWKFMSLGLTLARIYRIKLMEKYLSFHLSYFDVTRNSPGSLLTRMAINTMELNQMLTTILGTSIQCGCSFVVGILIGCLYQYRLILIDYSFVPVILILNILRRQFIESSSKRSITANTEAGGILTECVINTKTIFSFNFQHKTILMYLEVHDYVKRQFIWDALIMGLFFGLQNFCYFASNACVYYASKVFIINDTMDTDDISIIMNIVNISMQSFVISMGDLGNLKKAKVAFRSIYSTLETNSSILPFRKDNERKIFV